LNAWLSSVLRNGIWCWSPARLEVLVDIQWCLPKVIRGDCDKPMWVIAKKKKYTNSVTWLEVRMKNQIVDGWRAAYMISLSYSQTGFCHVANNVEVLEVLSNVGDVVSVVI
jgi:hypothetical protein